MPARLAAATIAEVVLALLEGNRDFVASVVVVTPAGDPTESVVRDLVARGLAVRLVVTPSRLSAGAARNQGRSKAGDCTYLAFVDADCVVEDGSVGRLLAALADGETALVAPRVVAEDRGFVSWLRHLLEFKESDEPRAEAAVWMVPSAAVVCAAADFDRVGGFPDLWPGEDLVFCWRLRDRGAVVLNDTTAIHRHPPGLKAAIGHQFRLGFTSAQARRMTGMKGAVFCRHRWLIPALVLARAANGVTWLCRFRPSELPRLFVGMPVYLFALTVWGTGFAYGSRAQLGRWLR